VSIPTTVERLREYGLVPESDYNDVLVRLTAAEQKLASVEEALKPFAEYLDTAKFDLDNKGEPLPDDQGMGWVYLTVGDFRRARTALQLNHGKTDGR